MDTEQKSNNNYAYNKLRRKLKAWAVIICVLAYVSLFSLVLQIRDNMCSCTSNNSCPNAISSEDISTTEPNASTNHEETTNSIYTPLPSADNSKVVNETTTAGTKANSDTSVNKPSSSSSSHYNLSPEYYENQAVADLAIERYYNDEWDGMPTEINGHIVSIDDYYGTLCIDGKWASSSKIHPQHILDLPPEIINNHLAIYIAGDGTYDIVNNRFVKYSHGKEVHLSGTTLDWKGMDTENYRPYDVYFYYDDVHDTLFLVASSVPFDYSSAEMKYNVGIYLYAIPDRTKSELKFIDEILNLELDEEGLFYQDTSQRIWRYAEKDGKLQFVRASNDLTHKFSRLGIAGGEIEFDWSCTFADGYIGNRDPFPEGTFSHPVVTTPYVPLTEYVPNYRYFGIYSPRWSDIYKITGKNIYSY